MGNGSKPNAFLRQIEARYEAKMRITRLFAIQWAIDAAVIAANRVFQRKGDIIVKFINEMNTIIQEIAQMTVDDAKADSEIVYTKETVDGLLRGILGDKFQPWEERYDFSGDKK